MREKWLTFVLRLTNRIYQYKQSILTQSGPRVIWLVFGMIASELVLGLVSIPLYLTLKPSKVTAFFAEKGAYEKIAFDYSLRRVLTLTGVGIVALIWALKLALIFVIPAVYGQPILFRITDLQPANVPISAIADETGIRAAQIGKDLIPPKLQGIKKIAGGDYVFFGKGQPGLNVVALLSDQQTVVYTAAVSKDGDWEINHSHKVFKLSPGNHSIIVFGYDKTGGVRSEAAPEQYFKVTSAWWDALANSLDIAANFAIIIVVAVGLFLIFLTI